MFLSPSLFSKVVESTPLVSIDLLVRSGDKVLLGLRTDRPAKGYWFVPGGRVLKNETLEVAYSRLCDKELGLAGSIEESAFKGVYEHLYNDSMNNPKISTHYIVLAHQLSVTNEALDLPKSQHASYKWFSVDELLNDVKVHKYTKHYFEK